MFKAGGKKVISKLLQYIFYRLAILFQVELGVFLAYKCMKCIYFIFVKM